MVRLAPATLRRGVLDLARRQTSARSAGAAGLELRHSRSSIPAHRGTPTASLHGPAALVQLSRAPFLRPSLLTLSKSSTISPTAGVIARHLSTSRRAFASAPNPPPSASSTSNSFRTPAWPLPTSRSYLSTRRQLRLLQSELLLLRQRLPQPSRLSTVLLSLLLSLAALLATYQFSAEFRRAAVAVKRCLIVGWAVVRCMVDYKMLFRRTWGEDDEGKMKRHEDYEACHLRCAERIRDALKKNGGIYIKLGQHLSSVQLIPRAWSSTMKPLQDQCFPTPLPALQALFLSDVGAPLSTFFSTFDPVPIGVASLAQVHLATDRESGRKVAVKIMHPDLEEFCAVDMKTTTFMLRVVKRVFPTFEFTWLGEEMEQNLPLEMDFRHEAANAARCVADFACLKNTTLVVPDVLWAKKRAMVMEYIEGARIDDLEYLAAHGIDRNGVSQQLSHIFSRMIYITGFFHADAHGGNLLIRPSQPGSRSPYNFEIVLLDHGLYFDMATDLRVNYARLWLALISPSSPSIEADRRKYAFLAGNIDDSLYPIFQAAITGRAALDTSGERGSMMELGKLSKEEEHRLRMSVVREGLMTSIFDLLRRVPRRMLMVLKVNDLTRALDASLHTTHGPARIFLIVAHYCNLAVYLSDAAALSSQSMSFSLIGRWIACWWRYERWNVSLAIAQSAADGKAGVEKWRAWWRGWRKEGWRRAWMEKDGLVLEDVA